MTTSTSNTDPIVITEAGQYITRDGRRAVVWSCPRHTNSSFKAEGNLVLREKPMRTEWTIWKTNGQWLIVGTSKNDIVGKWADRKPT